VIINHSTSAEECIYSENHKTMTQSLEINTQSFINKNFSYYFLNVILAERLRSNKLPFLIIDGNIFMMPFLFEERKTVLVFLNFLKCL
jgi:hypothetical protein